MFKTIGDSSYFWIDGQVFRYIYKDKKTISLVLDDVPLEDVE